ncbi:heavy metal-associated isoprenylated plant protein 39 [Citrus clementina]|nr:heavy metal-associated isoprenylated plant protein 39 [Citrus x clementina]
MDMKEKKLTVIGTVDPVNVMSKWRKYWPTDIILVGPTKEPEKPKEESKKEEPKKREEAKKEEPKRIEGNPYLTTHYHVQSIEENPNACVIC